MGKDETIKAFMGLPLTFEEAAAPLMKYLAENHHPHTMAEVESNKAVLWEGRQVHKDNSFLTDV